MFKQTFYIFSLLCVIFAAALSLALSRIVALPYWTLFADGMFHSAIFAAIMFLVWQIIRYGNYSALSLFQRIINYSAIGILTISIWLAASYGLFYWIFGEKNSILIINTLWVKGLIGALLYLLSIQYFYYKHSEKEKETEIETEPDEILEENTPKDVEEKTLERIAVKNGQKINVVLVSDIIYLQAEGDYVKIHTEKGKFLKEETMKYFQLNLPQKKFVRVHRSYIVNVEMIQRIEVYEKQNQLITLKNGEQIKASAAGYKQLKTTLNL